MKGRKMVMQQLTGKHLTAQSQDSRNVQDTINDDEGYEQGQIDTFSSRFLQAHVIPFFCFSQLRISTSLESTVSLFYVLHCEDDSHFCWL